MYCKGAFVVLVVLIHNLCLVNVYVFADSNGRAAVLLEEIRKKSGFGKYLLPTACRHNNGVVFSFISFFLLLFSFSLFLRW